jgi:magnesium transporter
MDRAAELSIAFLETYPLSAARVLDQIAPDDAAAYVSDAPEAVAATVLGLMQPARAAAVLTRSTPKKAAALLIQTPAHARSLLLRALPDETTDLILAAVPRRQAAALRRYLAYDPGTVGAWMEAPRATFTRDTTVGDCLDRIRRLGGRLGSVVFVIDAERRLLGTVDFEALLGADDDMSLVDLMRKGVTSLSPQASLTTVVSHTAWDTSLSLPVADRRRRLVGVLHFDSLREGLIVGRGSAGGIQANLLLVHLAQALLVTLSGLLHIAAAESAPTRMAGGEET